MTKYTRHDERNPKEDRHKALSQDKPFPKIKFDSDHSLTKYPIDTDIKEE